MVEVPTTQAENTGPIHRARTSLAALDTLDRLRQAPHTPPSPDDMAALRGWSGWGPLAPALEPDRSGTWKQIGDRIAYLLPREHYDHGIQAAYNAFYTPSQIASACWNILTGLGFTGGEVLEPGCGAGVFMAHTPADTPVQWIGVERDPTTAAIAGLLHPGATIHARRLEETPLASHSVDAVLGNVPFGDTAVYDPTAPRLVTANLHNYFLYRAVQSLRPGGIAVLLTSRYTLDAAGDISMLARSSIAWDADLLGAIRLPNSALAPGGTEPLTDILVLRRRRTDDPPDPDRDLWLTTGPSVGGQQVNSYLLANPHLILGELAEDSTPHYGRALRVNARPEDLPLPVALAAAGRVITTRAADQHRSWRVDRGAVTITADSAPFELRADGRKEGSFHLIDGVAHEVVDAQLVPVERPGKELPKLIALRDAVLHLLDAETDHAAPDTQLEPLRTEANRLYDSYVKAHGYLNRYTVTEGKPDENGVVQASRRRPSMGGFRRDPDVVTVLALEDFDDDTRTAAKAALLTRRVNRPRERATHADNPAEAIALCRDELSVLDIGRVAELLRVDIPEAERLIADVAFIDPATNSWTPADEYLTGNVRVKLAAAKAAAERDPERFSRNVPALEAAIPADLLPEQIAANLGAAWIPAEDVHEFAQDLLGFRLHVWHEPRTSTWSVRTSRRAEESAAATSEWGTSRVNAYELLEHGLNGKAPAVYDHLDDKRVRNQDESLAACDRLEAIATRFSTWIWEDPDRADRLAHAYNQTFNATVPRQFTGAHLTFPGLDPEFQPYDHQRDIVARMIAGSDALCPYPVGTGKTASMFMAAAKLKALGLATKPLIIVVPSTLEQIARDGKRLFPNARILMAGKEDLGTPRARMLFAARCAMEDWDAVVMSHPSFTSLSVHPTVEAGYVAAMAAEYRTALISAKADGAEPRKIKQIAKMVDNLEAGAKTLLAHATDDGVFFEHLGVDYLMVDEMHYFKNLNVPVHTDGFTVQGSKRAQDLDMKLGYLRAQHLGCAVVTGFTGTPVSNTLLEAFIIQHYLQPQRLAELGLQSADAWAATFVRFTTAVEVTPDGGFRLNRRPAEIVNTPELMHTLGEVAELRPPESFPVNRPDVRRHTVAIEASDTVLDYVRSLAERADDIHAGGVHPSDDNILKICSDGRKVALHESLVGLEPDGPGKIGALVENVARIYHETKDLQLPGNDPATRGALQLVFCDLGTPNKDKGSQIYGLIRHELIRAGLPADRIRFIHDATTDARRLVLFDQCTKGDVSVLLGSTDKLGVGVNIQKRAVALHHVDAPWRPDQVEQRDGRIWRPKNLNPAVDIYRYVTEGSFDAFMWQALERKEKALRPILSGQTTVRSIEDIGDIALDYGQIKAISTGNPLLTELNEVAFEVKRLSSLTTSHQRTQRRLRADIQTLTMQAAATAKAADNLDSITTTAAQIPDTAMWHDTRGNPITSEDLPTHLGTLVESTIAKGYCDGHVQWRGLHIDFTATKNWRDTDLAARVTTNTRHRIDVPLKEAWTAKGQHWRIRDAITTAIHNAPQTAAATRENITVLQQRITENNAALNQPFPDAAALDAAREHRATLETAIREQAQKDEQARRNRAARAAASTTTNQKDDRDALFRQLHAAMSTVAPPFAAATEANQDDARLADHNLDISSPLVEPTPDPVQDTASTPIAHEEPTEPGPPTAAHRTSRLRQRWHPPMSVPVDRDLNDTHTAYAAFCKDCEYAGPWHGREEGALEDEFDHAFPGWRELLPVVAAMEYKEMQNRKAYVQWKNTVVELYPTGWVEAGGPVLVARNRGGTRWHDDWFLGGNYNVCGVERAIDLHAPARHKGRTRLVAASYQPRDVPPPRPPDGPVGELTAQDTAAALAGIFTPGKLVSLSTGLRDKSALKVWLTARAQDSRDEHVGRRPTEADQPPTFDTVAETREGLAVVVLTETERREGLIPWSLAAEHLRPALTPEVGTRLSELYEQFHAFYTDPQREIEPMLTTLHALREQSAAIHHAAAGDLPANQRGSQRPTVKERSEMFEQAVDLALQGFAVFPLNPGTKRPMFKGWERLASTDPHQIARWWNATPNANIAIACGPSNLLVIDLDKAKKPDGPRHGQETLATLAAGREVPHTFTVASASGGRHLYYRQPDGTALSITTGSDTAGLGPLVDTRGHGGYIVAPGSVFNGGTYRIEHDAPVAPLPTWIADELTKRPTTQEPPPAPAPSRMPVSDRRRSAYGNAALKHAADTVARAPEGTRNDTLNRESFRLGRLVGGNTLDRNDAVAELRRAAHQAGLPPGEAANTIASGLTAGIDHPRSIPDPAPRPQTSHPPQEAAMTTTTDHEPRTTNQPTTTPDTDQVNGAIRPTQPDAKETAATTGNEREPETPERADAPSAEKKSSSTTDSTPTTPQKAATLHDPTTAAGDEFGFDFDEIWSSVRASIELARQAIPDWTELNTPDDLKPAINEALRYLAQAPIPRTAGDSTDSTISESAAPGAPEPAPPIDQTTDTAELGAEDLDEHLAAVDTAYADAQASGIPADRPEWAGIQAIHSAVHNLWDTLKAAASTYWAELSADIRVRGLLTALATRAARAIATLANTAATHLEQRGTQQLVVETEGPHLREAYINARNHVRAHAATHEWQRITALWGTVNTLTRQTGDPGIRAVVTRSADAISDYADTLGRKTHQYGHAEATAALTTLAAAAERHAASLRVSESHQAPAPGLHQTPTSMNSPQPSNSPPPPQQPTEVQLLQAKARQVAQHAQARLGHTPQRAATPRRAPSAANTRNQSNLMRPTQPTPRESTNIQIR
jgi:N12 class adenine-specific DNA methylase